MSIITVVIKFTSIGANSDNRFSVVKEVYGTRSQNKSSETMQNISREKHSNLSRTIAIQTPLLMTLDEIRWILMSKVYIWLIMHAMLQRLNSQHKVNSDRELESFSSAFLHLPLRHVNKHFVNFVYLLWLNEKMWLTRALPQPRERRILLELSRATLTKHPHAPP